MLFLSCSSLLFGCSSLLFGCCLAAVVQLFMEAASGSGKKSSDVWEYYEKIKDAPKSRCTLCNKELSYRGGTTNLRTHLECKHSLLHTHEVRKADSQCSSKQASSKV